MRSLLACCFGLFLLGCNGLVPQYRVEVQYIPTGTASLQVAVYIEGRLARDSPTFEVAGPRDVFSFGLNLGDMLAGEPTVSVAARGADGCLLAVGTSDPSSRPSTFSSVEIPLVVPDPPVAAAVCKSPPPLILAAIRRDSGPLQSIRFS